MPGAPTDDLTMSPPTSIAAAPSVLEVAVLPTALTKLTRTNCLGVSAGSAGQMSLPHIGDTL